MLAVLGAIAALLAWRWERHSRADGARFATRSDLAELRVRGPQAGRITLGSYRRATIAAEERASVLVVGPSQSGKTSGLVVPALLEWAGPALATSIKSDVVHDTHAARAGVGEVRVFDPAAATYLPHASWSPIAASRTWEGARRMAARLLGVGEHGGRSADETFWRPAGARYLAPLLLAAAHGELTMGDVLSWIARTDEQEPAEPAWRLHHPRREAGARGAAVRLGGRPPLSLERRSDPRDRARPLAGAPDRRGDRGREPDRRGMAA